MKIISIAHNAVTAKLIDADRETKLEVQSCLSYQVDGFAHITGFRGGWDGRANFLSFTEGTFPRGFVHHVYSHLTRQGYNVKIVRKPFPKPLGPTNPAVDDFPEDPRYDYQMQVVEKLLKYGQCISQIATGGGKSKCAKLATARINRPTLFLTTRGPLMYQMARSFRFLDKNVALLGDGNLQISKITCATVQTVMSWLKEPDSLKMNEKSMAFQVARRKKMIAALERFEFVILEEAHEASGNSFYEIMRYCKNAHYRLALTATPFMKDSEEANMRLMASSGPVAIKVSEKLLIDRGILAKPYFKFVELKEKPEKLYRSTPWQRAYKLGITENVYRNKLIIAEAIRGSRYGLSVMVLVLQKDHGRTLKKMFDSVGLKSTFIFGEDNQAARDAALSDIDTGKINVLIGSNILDVGIDVPSIGMVILAGGGKAEVALRQRIGRGLREKKNGLPNVSFIVDLADVHNDTLRSHYKQRRAIVEATEGFGENIVADFDFAGCGLIRKAA